jgi:hypothetical protein
VILIAFAALFILLLWLNFVLTQEIESMGREIQVKTEELNAVERQHEALLREICEAGSEQKMATMATALGYRPQTPVYLAVTEPIVQASSDAVASGGQSAALSAVEANSLLGLLARQIESSELSDGP